MLRTQQIEGHEQNRTVPQEIRAESKDNTLMHGTKIERKKERKPKGGFRDERCGLPHRLKGVSRRIVCTVNGLLERVRLVRRLVRAREKRGRITLKAATRGYDRVR